MKLIETIDGGYINPNLIESYAVSEHKNGCDVVAYAPSYGYDSECYKLATRKTRVEAQAWLELLINKLECER